MRIVRIAFVLVVALVACAATVLHPFPLGAVAVDRPAVQWHQWWEIAERCSGRTFPYRRVRWYFLRQTPTSPTGFRYNGESVSGLAFSHEAQPRIYLAESALLDSAVVIHEALHVIGSRGYHDPELYLRRCRELSVCVATCLNDTIAPRRSTW